MKRFTAGSLLQKEQHEKFVGHNVAGIVCVTLLTGVALLVVSAVSVNHRSVYMMDRMIRLQTGPLQHNSVPMTALRICWFLFWLSIGVILIGILGVVASLRRSKILNCTYLVLGFIFACFMLVAAILVLYRRTAVEPIVDKQVETLCNATSYVRLAINIPCDFASDYDQAPPLCSDACKSQVDQLKAVDGCSLLPELCKAFDYAHIDDTSCSNLIKEAVASSADAWPMWFYEGEHAGSCKEHCDGDIQCASYIYVHATDTLSAQCWLTQGLKTKVRQLAWLEVPRAEAGQKLNNDRGKSCFQRTTPSMLGEFKIFGTVMSVVTVILGLFLGISCVATLILTYDLNVRRQGKPSGGQLFRQLMCPCCARRNESDSEDFSESSNE